MRDTKWNLVIPAGLEPATYSLGNCRSIQLSYGTVKLRYQIWQTDGTPPMRLLRWIFALLLLAAGAQAQPLLCEAEGAQPFALARIEADGTLIGAEGQRLRLFGLLWPDRLEPARRALLQERLAAALAGQHLGIKPAAPPDRWGIQPAHVFVAESSDAAPFWLQAGLAEGGLAPGWPELAGPCWSRLMVHEHHARRARRGFWAPRAQAARHRALQAAPRENLGRRMVARWRVLSTRNSEVLTYVNIVPFFRVGPSLGLTSKQVQAMEKQGRPVATLQGRYVVARFLSGPAGLLRARLADGDALAPDED